ncbi:MAG: hypothetical protein C0482_10455 [Gordonia sp.]|nr:hypothetical protein [Gordonia sp. (in: high G+C Gram-positive bacteria)]
MIRRLRALLADARIKLLSLVVIFASMVPRTRAASRKTGVHGQRRAVLIGAYGNGNFGDDVIGHAIVRVLQDNGFAVQVAARMPTVKHLEASLQVPVVYVGGGLSSLYRTWRLAQGSEVAILGGGGLLEGKRDDQGVHRLVLEYMAKLLVCRLRTDRVLIHGIGISPDLYSSRIVSAAIRVGLRTVDCISVRDEASVLIANEIRSVRRDCTLVEDPATPFLRELAGPIVQDESALGVVLLDRGRWPHFKPSDAAAEDKRATVLRELADKLIIKTRHGKHIVLFSFHWSDPPIVDDLLKAFVRLGGDPDHVTIRPYVEDGTLSVFADLMRCGTIMSMRFHPALAALVAGSRVEIIGNLQKLQDLERNAGTSLSGTWTYPSAYNDPQEFLTRSLTADRQDDSLITRTG